MDDKEKIIWEDKVIGFFSHAGPKRTIIFLGIIYTAFIIYSIIKGIFSLILLVVFGGIILFFMAIYLLICFVQIKSYSNKVKIYSNGIEVKTSKDFISRITQVRLKKYFFPFKEIKNISIAPIYSEIGIASKGGYSMSGAQSLILYTTKGKKFITWLLDREGLLNALKKAGFDKIVVKKRPQIAI